MTTNTVHEIAAAMIDLDPTAEWDDGSIVDIARDLGIDLDPVEAPAVWTVYETLAFGHD